MAHEAHQSLTRRERQIMDVVYSRGHATAGEVMAALPDPPGYSAVRAMLRRLEEKGHLRHAQDGARYVYSPILPRDAASESALERLVRTFFDDSPTRTVAALLDLKAEELSDGELAELAEMIERAREKGR